jgi:hypothetical protein
MSVLSGHFIFSAPVGSLLSLQSPASHTPKCAIISCSAFSFPSPTIKLIFPAEMHVNPPPALIRFLEARIKLADIFPVQKIKDAFLDALAGFAVGDFNDLGAAIHRFLDDLCNPLIHIRNYRIHI